MKTENKLVKEFTDLPRRHARINPTGKQTKYWVAVDEFSENLNPYSKYVMPNLQLKDVGRNSTPSLTVDKKQAIELAKKAIARWPGWYVFVGQDKYSHGMMTGKDHLRASVLYIWDPVVRMWNNDIEESIDEADEESLSISQAKDIIDGVAEEAAEQLTEAEDADIAMMKAEAYELVGKLKTREELQKFINTNKAKMEEYQRVTPASKAKKMLVNI